jgi:hypothetical protein
MYILPPSQRQLQVEEQDSWQIPLHKGICRIFAIIRGKFENETGDILVLGTILNYVLMRMPTSTASPEARWKQQPHLKRRSSDKKRRHDQHLAFSSLIFSKSFCNNSIVFGISFSAQSMQICCRESG